METLEFDFNLKEVGPTGEFEGWASTYDLDLGNDKVLPGAFKTTLRKTQGKIPVLFNHDRHRIIGVGQEAQEDHMGLYVKAKLAMNTQLGRETHELMTMGALKGLSIGYTLPAKSWVMDGTVRMLKQIDLHEYSATPFPMNTQAQVNRIKAVEEMTARDFEGTLRELGFSKKEALCIMAKGFQQYLKERGEPAADSDNVDADEQIAEFLSQMKQGIDNATADLWLSSFTK